MSSDDDSISLGRRANEGETVDTYQIEEYLDYTEKRAWESDAE